MLTTEAIGDVSYAFDPQDGRSAPYTDAALSLQYNLEPNPAMAERFENISAGDLRLAQVAYHVFHKPFALYADKLKRTYDLDGHGALMSHEELIRIEGLQATERVFRLLRQLMGEPEYGGMQLKSSKEKKLTLLPKYFALGAEGKIIINKRDAHDIDLHVMGAILAIGDISYVITEGAAQGLKAETRNDRVDIGRAIDHSLSNIQNMWKDPKSSKASQLDLANALEVLMDFMGRHYPKDLPEEVAAKQLETLQAWQRERLFVMPASVQKAAAYIIVQ